MLIQTLDKADQDRNRELLHDVKEPELYEAALTVMMRLVFLLSAEERGLLLLGVGGFGTLAQLAMTRAYNRGRTLMAASLAYSTVIFASLFGMLFWSIVFYSVNAVVHFPFMNATMSPVLIALLNTVFRAATILVLLPFIR